MTEPEAVEWDIEIDRLAHVKEGMAAADRGGLWQHHPPSKGADPRDLDELEKLLGFALDPELKSFLRLVDGWRFFYQSVDLFGVADLSGGSRMQRAKEHLTWVESDVLTHAGLDAGHVVPIAATSQDLDLFVMPVHHGAMGPTVVWLAGTEIERFPSLREFFRTMVVYNERELATLIHEQAARDE